MKHMMWTRRVVSRVREFSGLNLRCLMTLVTVLLGVALAFLIAGYVTPGWMGYGWGHFDEGRTVWVGLWYVRECTGPRATVCVTKSLSEPDTHLHCYEITRNMTQYQVETTISLLTALAAMILVLDVFRSNSLQRPFVGYIGPMCLLAGIFGLTAGGTMIGAVKKGARLFKSSDCGNPYKVPYSAILTCAGSAIILFTAVLFIVTKLKDYIKDPGVKRKGLAYLWNT